MVLRNLSRKKLRGTKGKIIQNMYTDGALQHMVNNNLRKKKNRGNDRKATFGKIIAEDYQD